MLLEQGARLPRLGGQQIRQEERLLRLQVPNQALFALAPEHAGLVVVACFKLVDHMPQQILEPAIIFTESRTQG